MLIGFFSSKGFGELHLNWSKKQNKTKKNVSAMRSKIAFSFYPPTCYKKTNSPWTNSLQKSQYHAVQKKIYLCQKKRGRNEPVLQGTKEELWYKRQVLTFKRKHQWSLSRHKLGWSFTRFCLSLQWLNIFSTPPWTYFPWVSMNNSFQYSSYSAKC